MPFRIPGAVPPIARLMLAWMERAIDCIEEARKLVA
jgi:hypothetical protein